MLDYLKKWKNGVLATILGIGVYILAALSPQPPVKVPELPLARISAKEWVTTAPYTNIFGGVTVVIPKGFSTDLASIPDCVTNSLGITRDHPTIRTGALIHDWRYRTHDTTKAYADNELYRHCLSDGMERHKADAVLRAVTDLGFTAWDRGGRVD